MAGEHLLSAPPNQLRELPIGPATSKRLDPLPQGRLTIRFWGHDGNSYAICLGSIRQREHIYLRLYTRGAHGDSAQAAAEITDFVPVMLLEQEVRRLGGRPVAIQGIGAGVFTALKVGSRWPGTPRPPGKAATCACRCAPWVRR